MGFMAACLLCGPVACGGDAIAPVVRPLPTACGDAGGSVRSGTTGSQTWRAADGPHRLNGTVTAQTLTIEPGALVCAAAGARIEVMRLLAEGTAELPIRLTATNPAQPWGGIHGRSQSQLQADLSLAHVVLEHALTGVQGGTGSAVDIRSSTIRHILGPGLVIGDTGEGSLIESSVDSACLSTCAGVQSAAAVHVLSTSTFRFENSRITDSGAAGLLVRHRSFLTLLGGEIRGSAGTGLDVQDDNGRPVNLVAAALPITITGGAGHPARLPLQIAARLLPTREAQQTFLGNARDTVIVTGETGDADSVSISAGLAWAVNGSRAGRCCAGIGRLHLLPGAVLAIRGAEGIAVSHLVSSGTAAAPVRVNADSAKLWLLNPDADTSRVEHTHFRGALVEVGTAHTAVFDQVSFDNSTVRLSARRSRMRNVRFTGARHDAPAALVIDADDVLISNCEVTASLRDGIQVTAGSGVRINNCNVHGNTGAGVRNVGGGLVDARNNWWGGASGPFGPGGDGVAGLVEFEPFHAQPLTLGIQRVR
jgi:hypothetical protein